MHKNMHIAPVQSTTSLSVSIKNEGSGFDKVVQQGGQGFFNMIKTELSARNIVWKTEDVKGCAGEIEVPVILQNEVRKAFLQL